MQFSEKGTMDPMNGYFSPINGLESVYGIQFSLCGTPTNLIFAHRVEPILGSASAYQKYNNNNNNNYYYF